MPATGRHRQYTGCPGYVATGSILKVKIGYGAKYQTRSINQEKKILAAALLIIAIVMISFITYKFCRPMLIMAKDRRHSVHTSGTEVPGA